MRKKLTNKLTAGRRKFLMGASAFTLGSLFLGYKAISSNAANAGVKQTSTKQTSAKLSKEAPAANARLGINLSGIAYWASEFPFVDLMHQSGEWVSQPASGDWGKGPALALDAYGWVKALDKDCRATKIICAGGEVAYPSGTYAILYDGEGELKLTAPVGQLNRTEQGRYEAEVDATKGMLAIDIIATNPKNHLRNIRVIAPGFEASYQSNPWHPKFLSRWSGVACVRFMDMMATNNSKQQQWKNRPKPNDASYAKNGVPVELLVDLANRLSTDAWFCMPHLVDDGYVKQFATVVKRDLKPPLRAWLEYSNEVWNGGFAQYRYAAEQGQQAKLASDQWNAAYHYYARRSAEVFTVWHQVFEDRDRVVNVVASQAANAYLSSQILKVGDLGAQTDVLAIAPYVSFNVPLKADDKGISAANVSAWRLDKLFDYLNSTALPQSKKWMTENKKVANRFGLPLVAYEAGQHLVGIQGAENNAKLTDLLKKANADARMGEVYTSNLKHWQMAGGDLMCTFTSVEGWSKWGSWGLLQHTNDAASPKFTAVMNWAKSRGQKVNNE